MKKHAGESDKMSRYDDHVVTDKESPEELNSIRPLNLLTEVLGLQNTCLMRSYGKRHRNPDVFTYDSSIDYKEDFSLIPESKCDCGCKSAIYTKEEWTGDGTETTIKTQTEWESLPNIPKPTPEQIQLTTKIIKADRQEEALGIIHDQRSCEQIPVPKLIFNGELYTVTCKNHQCPCHTNLDTPASLNICCQECRT